MAKQTETQNIPGQENGQCNCDISIVVPGNFATLKAKPVKQWWQTPFHRDRNGNSCACTTNLWEDLAVGKHDAHTCIRKDFLSELALKTEIIRMANTGAGFIPVREIRRCNIRLKELHKQLLTMEHAMKDEVDDFITELHGYDPHDITLNVQREPSTLDNVKPFGGLQDTKRQTNRARSYVSTREEDMTLAELTDLIESFDNEALDFVRQQTTMKMSHGITESDAWKRSVHDVHHCVKGKLDERFDVHVRPCTLCRDYFPMAKEQCTEKFSFHRTFCKGHRFHDCKVTEEERELFIKIYNGIHTDGRNEEDRSDDGDIPVTQMKVDITLDLFGTIKSFFSKDEEVPWSTDKIIAVLNFILMGYNMRENLSNLIAFAVQTACVFGMASKVFDFAKSCASRVMTQGPTEFGGALMGAILSIFATGYIPDQKSFDWLLLRLDRLPKGIAGLGKLMEYFTQFITTVKDWATGTEESLLPDFFETWHDRSMFILRTASEDPRADLGEIRSLIEDADVIGKQAMVSPFKTNLSHRFDRVLGELRAKARCLERQGVDVRPRLPPCMIYLWGDSGVGKSVLNHMVPTAIMASDVDFEAKNLAAYIHVRDKNNEYWEGINANTRCVLYDDIFQTKDTKGVPNPEIMEIIRAKGTTPWMLHMADVEDKGKVYFNSRLVMGTSNVQTAKFESIHKSEAVWRRFDIRAKVRVKKEYLTSGRIDEGKVLRKLGAGVRSEIYAFDLEEVNYPHAKLETVNFDDFINIATGIYKDVRRKGAALTKTLEEFAQEAYANFHGDLDYEEEEEYSDTEDEEGEEAETSSEEEEDQAEDEGVDETDTPSVVTITPPASSPSQSGASASEDTTSTDDDTKTEGIMSDKYHAVSIKRYMSLSSQHKLLSEGTYNVCRRAMTDGFLDPRLFNRRFYKTKYTHFCNYTMEKPNSIVALVYRPARTMPTGKACSTFEDTKRRFLLGLVGLEEARTAFPGHDWFVVLYDRKTPVVSRHDPYPELDIDPACPEEGSPTWSEIFNRMFNRQFQSVCFKNIKEGLQWLARFCSLILTAMTVYRISKSLYQYWTGERAETESVYGHAGIKQKVVTHGSVRCDRDGPGPNCDPPWNCFCDRRDLCRERYEENKSFLRWFINWSKFQITCSLISVVAFAMTRAHSKEPTVKKEDMNKNVEMVEIAIKHKEQMDDNGKWCPTEDPTVSQSFYCLGCDNYILSTEGNYCGKCRGGNFIPQYVHDPKTCTKCEGKATTEGKKAYTISTPKELLTRPAALMAWVDDIEAHHGGRKWCYSTVKIPGALGGKARLHHQCRKCKKIVKHIDSETLNCYACMGVIGMPDHYWHENACTEHADTKTEAAFNSQVEKPGDFWCPALMGREINNYICIRCCRVSKRLQRGVCASCSGETVEDGFFHNGCANCFTVSQGLLDSNTDELISMKVFSNMITVGGETGTAMMNGTFIVGHTMMMNQHFWDWVLERQRMNKDYQFSFGLCGSDDPFYVPVKDCKWANIKDSEGKDKDLVLVEIPKHIINAMPDIRRFFAKSADYANFDGGSCVLIKSRTVRTRKGNREFLESVRFPNCHLIDYKAVHDVHNNSEKYIRRGYRYTNAGTKSGDCGSLGILENTGSHRVIAFSHSAGNSSDGFGTSVCQEDLERCNAKLAPNLPEDLTYVQMRPEGSFVVYGKLKDHKEAPPKSNLSPSQVHGDLQEAICKPAHLGLCLVDDQPVDPLLNGAKKSGKPCKTLDRGKLAKAVNGAKGILFKPTKRQRRLLTIKESVFGVEGDKYINKMEPSTSPGYPWTEKRGDKPGKRAFMNTETEEISEEMRLAIVARIEDLNRGERTRTIWTDCPKDEKRPIEKVDIGKTRLFCCGPMDYNAVSRAYMGMFVAAMMEGRIENSIAVGINPYSYEWQRVQQKMLEIGPKCVAGDFSNFDGTLHSQILWEVINIINAWYDDEYSDQREILWSDIVNSIHLIRGILYNWHHSNPSGNIMTAILNSIYLLIALIYVFITIMPEGMNTTDDFRTMVYLLSYGDDNIMSIAEIAIQMFNQQTIAEGFKELGMVYTTETKEETDKPYRSLSEITFLKRGFVEERGEVRAPMILTNILEIANWVRVRKGRSVKVATEDNLENVTMELAMHDSVFFEIMVDKIRRLCMDRGLDYYPLTREEYLFRMRNGHYFPFIQMKVDETSHLSKGYYSFEHMSEHRKGGHHFTSMTNSMHYHCHSEDHPGWAQVQDSDEIPWVQADIYSAPEGTAKQEEIAKFEQVEEDTSYGWDSSNNVPSAQHDKPHTIASFLKRPIMLDGLTWAKADQRGHVIKTIKFPQCIKGTQWEKKLEGFAYLRADLVVKIQVNSMPFQSGMLFLTWRPGKEPFQHQPITAMCSRPRQVMNIESQQNIEFTCPFINMRSHIPLCDSGDVRSYIEFDLMVYSPVTVDDARIVIWIYLDNVDFVVPTPVPVNLPTYEDEDEEDIHLGGRAETQMALDCYSYDHPGFDDKFCEETPVCQSKEIPASVKVMRTTNVVGRVIGGISSAVGAFIPPVGFIGGGVALATRAVGGIVGGIMSLFGMTKHIEHKPEMAMRQQYAKDIGHVDGTDFSKTYLMHNTSKMQIGSDMFHSDMDIVTIARTPGYIETVSWQKAIASGSNLFSLDIKYMWQTLHSHNVDGENKVYRSQPPMTQAAFYSEYVTGGMIFIFHFIKTRFHSGAVRFWFQPEGVASGTLDKNKAGQVFCDIRAQSFCAITVPYCSNTPMRRIRNRGRAAGKDQSLIYGQLHCEVVNPLVGNDNVSDEVDILIEVCGAKDFALANPGIPVDMYNNSLIYDSSITFGANFCVTQMDEDLTAENYIVKCQQGAYPNPILDIPPINAEKAIMSANADPFLSLKALIQRFSFIERKVSTPLQFLGTVQPEWTLLKIITAMYYFRTGGVRFKFYIDNNFVSWLDRNPITVQLTDYVDSAMGGMNVFPAKEEIAELELPFVHDVPFSYVFDLPALKGTILNDRAVLRGRYEHYDTSSQTYINKPGFPIRAKQLYVAGSDNYRCGFFVGIPPYYYK